MTRDLHHWIDGRARANGAAATVVVSGPLDRLPVATVPLGSAKDVDDAVAAARQAFPAWRNLAPVERGRLLAKVAARLRERERDFVDVEVSETGKLTSEMVSGLHVSADYFEFYAGVVRALFGETINLGAGDHAFTSREPFGVVGMITPWNGPLTQASRGVSAALAAGNTVVLKPSEFTSSTSVMLAELASDVGLPPGVLNVVLGTGTEVGSSICAHPDVRLLAFTGSVGVGKMVARAAADRLVPAILELGGKSANIVFDDADLERATQSALTICVGAGQQCSALSRLLLQDTIYEDFLARVGAAMTSRVPGPTLAPMTTEAQYDKVVEYFEVARAEGARLVTGGRAVTGELARGRYVEATVYADVTPDMRLFREEVFGPVLAATPFTTEDEAIALANDSEFGLAASVWTTDSARGLRVASSLESGQVMINGGRSGIETPFGGYKASGIGREKGFESLKHYTQVKTTIVSTR
ncbi:aldehyde dehydrogenase (plasmid) [Mycolicibacterium madagascariense]|uniref:Aldehyde dehydrogenase n=1 Tax=Mycolicibacterium madagascariense TaxID=212765 RepID=A0A7I7XQ90_9MYCO|nr:aldehyde dehydrogenase family protein [Mycolicibacterium madagascariense]BBZ31212.1 aldehyde dehydrogenase [Mycolicibacterium madagascariense]